MWKPESAKAHGHGLIVYTPQYRPKSGSFDAFEETERLLDQYGPKDNEKNLTGLSKSSFKEAVTDYCELLEAFSDFLYGVLQRAPDSGPMTGAQAEEYFKPLIDRRYLMNTLNDDMEETTDEEKLPYDWRFNTFTMVKAALQFACYFDFERGSPIVLTRMLRHYIQSVKSTCPLGKVGDLQETTIDFEDAESALNLMRKCAGVVYSANHRLAKSKRYRITATGGAQSKIKAEQGHKSWTMGTKREVLLARLDHQGYDGMEGSLRALMDPVFLVDSFCWENKFGGNSKYVDFFQDRVNDYERKAEDMNEYGSTSSGGEEGPEE